MDELSVTDGAIGCDLAALPNTVLEYLPKAPWPDGDGGAFGSAYPQVVQVRYANVDESLRAALGGETLALALAEREKLARLLRQAERVQAGSGEARVYVVCRRQADLCAYRAELLAGSVVEMDVEGYWPGRGQLRVLVHWLRRPWWEGAETEIALLGPLGDEQLGGMEVISAGGPRGGAGYVDLAATGGDLVAPLKLKFTNSAAGYAVHRLYAGLHSRPQPITLIHVLEGEAARSGGVTQPAGIDGQCSGGKYRALSWNDTAETRLVDWTLTGEQLALAAGRWYRLLARWYPAPVDPDLLVQSRVTIDGTTTLWAGPWVRTSAGHEICDLGSLALPPFAGPGAGLHPLRLELWARRSSAGGHSLNVDYLGLLAQDGFRRYDALPMTGAGLDQDAYLVDDGPAGEMYAHAAEGNATCWLAMGDALAVRPGCQHRLCLAWENASGQARADRLALVQLWYRPRVVLP